MNIAKYFAGNELMLAVLLATVAVLACVWLINYRKRGTHFANIAEGIHGAAVTRIPAAAITTRNLLYMQGAAADKIAVMDAVTKLPLGTVNDTITAGEITAGQQVALLVLGKGPTKLMVASEAIDAGEAVFAAADGKITDLPTGAGTYYCVGTALTTTAADGDLCEVADCIPFKVVVSG